MKNYFSGNSLANQSAIALLVANVIALSTAMYSVWGIYELLLLYWLETAVIGFFTVLKILHGKAILTRPLAVFFCFHFGLFMLVHLMLIFALWGFSITGRSQFHISELPLELSMFTVILLPAAAFFGSHLISYMKNFLGKQEYLSRSPFYFFTYPYPRVIVMHITVMALAFVITYLDALQGPLGLILLAFWKTAIDLSSHQQMHFSIAINSN
jgi:Family of unknown function (DUF6498)